MNKKRVIFLTSIALSLLALTIYFNRCTFSQVKTIDSFAQASTVLLAADKNTLVLFDVDETLIIPASVTMRTKTKEQHQQWLKQTLDSMIKSLPKPEDYYFDNWAITETPLVIEPSIIATIKSLQDRGVKVLALTNLSTGSRYQIQSLPEWRFAKLHDVGIDFSKVSIPDTIFTDLPIKNGTYPVLSHGILATNQESKGLVLGAFLDYIKWKPKHVIFFDDSLKRVNEVAQEMCRRNISFTGYHYQGADYVPGDLDKEVAAFQFKYLFEHERWLNDAQVREQLKH